MRTQSNYQEPDSNLYYVCGRLRLRFRDVEADIGKLRVAIEDAENRMPWIDRETNAPQQSGVMFQSSDFDYTEAPDLDNPFWPVSDTKITAYEFSLRGDRLPLDKGQMYAYEKHVEKLAEELARMRVCNVDVRGSIQITRYHYFDVPDQS